MRCDGVPSYNPYPLLTELRMPSIRNQNPTQEVNRKVSAMFRVRIADYRGDGTAADDRDRPVTTAFFSVWRVSEDVYADFAEGTRLRVCALPSHSERFWMYFC